MQKNKDFPEVRFTPEVIREARELVESHLAEKNKKHLHVDLLVESLSGDSWHHDNEDEFFADYRSDHRHSEYRYGTSSYSIRLSYGLYRERTTNVSVTAPSRQEIEAIFNIFEKHVESCKLPPRAEE